MVLCITFLEFVQSVLGLYSLLMLINHWASLIIVHRKVDLSSGAEDLRKLRQSDLNCFLYFFFSYFWLVGWFGNVFQ